MEKFKAFSINEVDKKTVAGYVDMGRDDLDPGEAFAAQHRDHGMAGLVIRGRPLLVDRRQLEQQRVGHLTSTSSILIFQIMGIFAYKLRFRKYYTKKTK